MTKQDIIAELKALDIAHRVKAPKAELERLLTAAKKPTREIAIAPGDEFKPFRDGTKQAALFTLITRENGASIQELVKATGWQPSSVKSAFYLDMRKMHGVGVREVAGRYHAIVPK